MLRKLSCGSANNDLERHRSRVIDKELRADRKRYRSTYRLLLLGKLRRHLTELASAGTVGDI